MMLYILITISLWVFITLYWIISSMRMPAGHRGNEIMSFIKLIGSSLLMYVPLLTGGYFATALYIPNPISNVTGTLFCLSGILIMVWAREHLGRNWSGNVIIQQQHTLTKDGPYQFVRHPIYSGGLFAMMGSAIVLGQIFAFIWVVFCAFGLIMKMKQEEILLSGQFPEEYPDYKKRVKMLVPFIF